MSAERNLNLELQAIDVIESPKSPKADCEPENEKKVTKSQVAVEEEIIIFSDNHNLDEYIIGK